MYRDTSVISHRSTACEPQRAEIMFQLCNCKHNCFEVSTDFITCELNENDKNKLSNVDTRCIDTKHKSFAKRSNDFNENVINNYFGNDSIDNVAARDERLNNYSYLQLIMFCLSRYETMQGEIYLINKIAESTRVWNQIPS